MAQTDVSFLPLALATLGIMLLIIAISAELLLWTRKRKADDPHGLDQKLYKPLVVPFTHFKKYVYLDRLRLRMIELISALLILSNLRATMLILG
jgi:hypothetical protein